MIPHLGSFRIKLAAYFVLLSLLPVGAAFWGFSSLAGHDETRRSDTRLESELRSTLANYRDQLVCTGDGARNAPQRPRTS